LLNGFTIQSFANDVYLIRESHVAWWLRCNIWFIKGREKNLIIDTGMGLWPLKEKLLRLSDNQILAVMTHSHFDHMGGSFEFDCRLGHRREAHVFKQPDCDGDDYSNFVRVESFSKSPWDGFEPALYTVKPAALTGYLDEGDQVDLGNRRFNVFHLPGHSPGSIVLFEEKSGVLFSGDVIYDGDLIDIGSDSNKEQYKESLGRLSELNIETVHGGHYDSFGRDRMLEIISLYRKGQMRMEDYAEWVTRKIQETE